MNILIPVDIEEEVRLALADYMQAYCPPLPANFETPCILAKNTGGTSDNKVDEFVVTLDSRAKTEAEAYELLRKALGVLRKQAILQKGALRKVAVNSLARWGTDPARPDLSLCTATVLITAHSESATVSEES